MKNNIGGFQGVFKDYYPEMLNYILVFEMPWVLNGKPFFTCFKTMADGSNAAQFFLFCVQRHGR